MLNNINWYPGHMKKTREMTSENLKLVDIVIEVVDARIPVSSRNPIIDDLIKNKERIVVMNKSDLADKETTSRWLTHFRNKGYHALALNSMRGEGLRELLHLLEKIRAGKNAVSLRNKPFRIMIVGVPNSGKSSLINRLTGKKSTQTGDRPGVTKGKQWLTVKAEGDMGTFQLLDTPGILWPKFEDPNVGMNLAFCGSIKDEIMDQPSLALELIAVLALRYPAQLKERYKLDPEMDFAQLTPLEIMETIATKRGFVMAGKRYDYERTARTLLDEFRGGLIGKITLEDVASSDREQRAFQSEGQAQQ
jgi:ribosome biogenesis GTPase A